MEKTDALAVVDLQPTNLLQALVQVATTPGISIDVIERMVALQERQEARQAQTAFMGAMARLQAKLPLIVRGGENSFTHTRYARLEDIHDVIKPLLAEEGFSLSFDEESASEGMVTFSGKLSHRDGHFEVKRLTVPIDKAATNSSGKPTRTGIQDAGSTASYAIRYLTKMFLNIAETNEDNDGNSKEKITKDQALDLNSALDELKSDMDRGRFLVFMGVGALDEILVSDWKKALNAIDTKRREVAEKKAKAGK